MNIIDVIKFESLTLNLIFALLYDHFCFKHVIMNIFHKKEEENLQTFPFNSPKINFQNMRFINQFSNFIFKYLNGFCEF